MDRGLFRKVLNNLILKILKKTKQVNSKELLYKSNIVLIESGFEIEYHSRKNY